VTEVLTAVLPSLGVLGLFLLGLRAMLHADRRERAAEARLRAGKGSVPDPVEPPTVPPVT
jgi:hypothetical protein